jgi:hypothetical protein
MKIVSVQAPQQHQDSVSENKTKETQPTTSKAKEYEAVLNSGLEFLSGLMKMSTGKDTGLEGKSVEINEETGEIVMKFKLPAF